MSLIVKARGKKWCDYFQNHYFWKINTERGVVPVINEITVTKPNFCKSTTYFDGVSVPPKPLRNGKIFIKASGEPKTFVDMESRPRFDYFTTHVFFKGRKPLTF